MHSEIVQKIKEKNKTALEQLYTHYERTVYKLAFQIIGDSFLSEKVVQQLFTQIWDSKGEILHSNYQLSVQILKITRQIAYDEKERQHGGNSTSPGSKKPCCC